MISADDVKANKTSRKKDLKAGILQIFIRCTFIQNSKYIQCKKDMYFSFDFGWNAISILILSVINLLSVMQVICQFNKTKTC